MKLLKVLALVFFFIHYYVAIVLIFLLNIVKYAWKIVAQISTDKHHVNPFTATHAHVFAPLRKSYTSQINLFRMKVSLLTLMNFKLQMEQRYAYGELNCPTHKQSNPIQF